MYGLLRTDYYWTYMFKDVYNTVKNCSQCQRMDTKFKHQKQLELFAPYDSLKLVSIDISGSLPRTKIESDFVVICLDRYSRLTRPIPTATYTSTQIAHIFLHKYVVHYGIPDVILSVSNYFAVNLIQLTDHYLARICTCNR